MRSCEEFELLASLVIDEEAAPEEQAELAKHIESCPACRAYFEDLKRIHGTFVREDASLPEGFAARVMERVRETAQDFPEEKKPETQAKVEKKTVPFPRRKRWAALAACCAVVALSVWAVRMSGGVKEARVAADSLPQDYAGAGARSMDSASAAQELEAPPEDGGASLEDTESPDEAPAPMPEEYAALAESAAKEGAGEGEYDRQSKPEPALAASPPPEDTANGEDTDAVPAPAAGDAEELAPGLEDDLSGEEQTEENDGSLEEEKDILPAEGPALPEEEAEPVEVIGLPEPGILIAYGSAAQNWVESTLGLEWASGGSYPLTAEQYGGLLRVLDEAGELYRIEPGEGYCLMTE